MKSLLLILSKLLSCFSNKDKSDESILDLAFISKMMDIGMKACQDKNKIKPHGVRCVGNLVALLNDRQVQKLEPKVTHAIETLIQCASSGNNMKMRWNSCHALGNILNCQHLAVVSSSWRVTRY